MPRTDSSIGATLRGGLMAAVRFRISQCALMLATTLTFAMLSTAGNAYTPEEQQACSDDAFRLCSAEIPDVDRVGACMDRRRAELSPGCRVYFRPIEPEAPVIARKPVSLKAAARSRGSSGKISSKAQKPKKSSKSR
jgi:hypothetical protein